MSLPQEQTCKGCSLAVQPGYPKCPRCKMPLPTFEAPLAAATKADRIQGGTHVEDESASRMILYGLLLLALIAGVGVVLLTGSDQDATPARDTPEAPSQGGGTETPASGTDDTPVGIQTSEFAPNETEKQQNALASLDQVLSENRLWSTVSSEDSTILIVSAACEDANMLPSISKVKEGLLAVGFVSVRCTAKHGEQVFEQVL